MAYNPHAWSTGSDHGHSRSGHVGPRSYNPWEGPADQGQVAFSDPFGQHHSNLSLNTSLGIFPQHQDSATTPTPLASESIKHWARNEEPWSSVPLATPRLDSLDTSVGQHYHRDAFAVPRSPARSISTASAMGPPHIDSAYCSTASPNANEPSTANSDCPDITYMFGNMPDSFSNASDSPATPARKLKRAPASVPSTADEPMSLPDDGKCTFCHREFRLKSELKKHVLRHTRPFRCCIPTCNGSREGFTTSNDLDRHNRSVHSMFPKGAKVYVCGAKNCAEGEKTWPRYDNFKQHCERMHKQEDLETLISKSERQAPPPPDDVQQYLPDYSAEYNRKLGAGKKRSAITDTASVPPREPPRYSPQESAFYDHPQYPSSDASSWSGYHPYSDLGNNPSTRIARNTVRNIHQGRRTGPGNSASMSSVRGRMRGSAPQIVLHQADNRRQQQHEQQQQEQLAHMQFDQVTTESPVDFFPESKSFPQQQHPRTQSAGNLLTPNMARSHSLSSHSSASSSGQATRGRAATISGGDASRAGKRKHDGAVSNPRRVRCKWPGCNKADMRPCELKKHERRHSRPFGCTFDYCNKAFGSKNDWKRHESSQHFQDEMWRCGQAYQPASSNPMTISQSDCETAAPCALVFPARDDLVAHLTAQHGIVDSETQDDLCTAQHIGRNHCSSFWCGFCCKVTTLENEGRKGWDERFDHIGRHFHPGNLSIADWVPPIGNKSKGVLLAEKQREMAQSESSVAGSDVDALGEADDGTPTLDFSTTQSNDGDVDSAAFPSSVQASFDGTAMSGLEFTGMGPQQPPTLQNQRYTTSAMQPGLSLNTQTSGFVALNGQLPSPAASGSEACTSVRRRKGGSAEPAFCCICQDGPMNSVFKSGLQCLTCGHICGEGCCER